MKILIVSDLHLVEPGKTLYGLDPSARLDACLADIASKHHDAACCILSGDLADRGEHSAYVLLQERLRSLSMPVHLMVGNHDHRERFAAVFPDTPRDDKGFVHRVVNCGDVACVLLDSVMPGSHAGILCPDRLDWLRNTLDGLREKRVLVFLHHHPMEIGIAGLDAIALGNGTELGRVLKSSVPVEHLFFGHTHRRISGNWCGIPFTGVGSTNHHVATEFSAESPLTFSYESPSYAVVLIEPDQMVVHFEDFLDETGFVRD